MSNASHEAMINGRFLTRSPTGVDRFAIQMIKALDQDRSTLGSRVGVPSGSQLFDPEFAAHHRVDAVGRRQGHAWEQIDLPRAAGDQALINLCNTAPLLRENQLVVIHDLGTVANASNYSVGFRSWYRLMHGSVMRRARVVATVSRFSADELSGHYGRRSRGIEVIHEAGEHIHDHPAETGILDRLELQGRRFVLAVGSTSPNKNFSAVLQAVRLLDDPDLLVVTAGGADARVFSSTFFDDPRLRVAGYVTDGELRALYENASCFAFPSYYEGFGLPPLEAMCCGCPVIVSDRASLPEVCGDAALYCKAEDPATLATALRGLLASPSHQEDMREAGLARSAKFSWAKAASQFEEIVHANF
jgi:glycosyltransferase involved in cell wall biosynthesis